MDKAATIDLYALLGVARDASAREIRRAYRRLARQHHPDLNPQPDGPERFGRVTNAYAILQDPVRRADYDRNLTRTTAAARSPRIPDPPTSPGAALGVLHGTLELSPAETSRLEREALVLHDDRGHTIVLTRGTGHGDQITVPYGPHMAVLTIQSHRKT